MTGFDLTTEPWIPCELRDGSRLELGISETLSRAHELSAIVDSSPLVTATLHRMVLAVLHRCFGPKDIQTWIELYKTGRFDPAAIQTYLDEWRHRFDLLHPTEPFMQVRGLPFDPDPISSLITERSNWGGGVHLFEGRPDGLDDVLTCAAAARWLLAFHAFAPGGLVKKSGEPTSASGAPLQRGLVVLVRGQSLFETLMLNLLVVDPKAGRPIPGGPDDAPSWERSPLPRTLERNDEPKRVLNGWLDALTWQSRRLELLANSGGQITGWVRCVGQGFESEVRDPMQAFKIDERSGVESLRFDIERALWRDLHALLQATNAEDVRPRAIEQLGDAHVRACVPSDRRFALDLLGLRGDQAKILLVRAERVPVTSRLLTDPDLGEAVRNGLIEAEEGASALRAAIFVLARHTVRSAGTLEPDKKVVNAVAASLGAPRAYWPRLRVHFERFIDEVGEDDDRASKVFARSIRNEVRRAFDEASSALGSAGRHLKGAAMGERTLNRHFGRMADLQRQKEVI